MTFALRRLSIVIGFLLVHWCRSELDCTIWQARDYRDCFCGTEVLDSERHCEDDHTYFETTLHQESLFCGFHCNNGGTAVDHGGYSYECHCPPGFYGYCCELETECGSYERAPYGNITSPNYGRQPYPSNTTCTWRITTDYGKRIALGVKNGAFSVEEGSNINLCDNDYVTVYDGEDRNSRKIGPFCGNTSRPFRTIHSSGRHLFIEFKSNGESEYAGFDLEYTTYRTGLRCGPRREYRLPAGIITSPQYPLHHRPHEDCEYEIAVLPDHEVILTTLHMNLPSEVDCSSGDSIEVMTRSDPMGDYQRITRLCGEDNYAPFTIRNSTHVMLKFTSGFINEGQFKIRYDQLLSFIL